MYDIICYQAYNIILSGVYESGCITGPQAEVIGVS